MESMGTAGPPHASLAPATTLPAARLDSVITVMNAPSSAMHTSTHAFAAYEPLMGVRSKRLPTCSATFFCGFIPGQGAQSTRPLVYAMHCNVHAKQAVSIAGSDCEQYLESCHACALHSCGN